MLSQQLQCPGVGCDSSTPANPHHLRALPPHHQALLAGYPSARHHLPLGVYVQQTTAAATCDYGWPLRATHHLSPRQTAKKVGSRSMMRPSSSSTSPTSSSPASPAPAWLFPLPARETSRSVFTFVALPPLAMDLTFPPRPSPPRPRKRCRAVTDVDGEYSCLHKKKRRLRLFLITSRLSPQFSHPATNIVDRGNSKIAVWAKQRALGRNLLRKAAILNRIRRRAIKAKETGEGLGRVLVEQEREQKQLELARLAFVYGSHDPHSRPVFQQSTGAVRLGAHFDHPPEPIVDQPSPTPPSPSPSDDEEEETPTFQSPNDAYSYAPRPAQIPRKSYIPLPPSPLGLSNYDAFDLDDDIPDPYSHLDDDDDELHNEDMHEANPRSPSANTSASFSSTLSTVATGTGETLRTPPQLIYSDFSILDPGEPVVGDYDGIDDGADAIWPNALAPETKKAHSSPGSSPRLQPQSGSLLPASSSPNFTAIFATASLNDTSSFYPSETAGIEALGRKEAEMKQERERQKNLMFLRFDS